MFVFALSSSSDPSTAVASKTDRVALASTVSSCRAVAVAMTAWRAVIGLVDADVTELRALPPVGEVDTAESACSGSGPLERCCFVDVCDVVQAVASTNTNRLDPMIFITRRRSQHGVGFASNSPMNSRGASERVKSRVATAPASPVMLGNVIVWLRQRWQHSADSTAPATARGLGFAFLLIAFANCITAFAWHRPLYFILAAGFTGVAAAWFHRSR